MKRTLGSCVVLSILSFSAFGQSNPDQDRKDRPATQAQITEAKRLWELLRHPTFITIRLVSTGRDIPNEPAPSTTPSPYVVGERLHFQSFITQTSNEELLIIGDRSPYYAYRPQLIRDADPVPYSKHAQERIENAEGGSSGFSNAPTRLESGREYRSNDVRLEDWYDLPVKAGHYQLTIKRRFTGDGDWVESNPVTFDVVASKSASSLSQPINLQSGTGLKSQDEPRAQSDDDLNRLDEKLRQHLADKMTGWVYKRIDPIQGSKGVLLQSWAIENRGVSISIVLYNSADAAKEAIQRLAHDPSTHAQPVSGTGEEAYAWCPFGCASVPLARFTDTVHYDVIVVNGNDSQLPHGYRFPSP
jgi:hypothetical protein